MTPYQMLARSAAAALLFVAPEPGTAANVDESTDSGLTVERVAGRPWTLADQLSVPRLSAVAISEDGGSAAYVTRVADTASDKTLARLTLVDLESGASRELLHSEWIDQLRRIPGSNAWSALVDRGEGVQLYRIEADGGISPIIIHPASARFGEVDGWLLRGFAHAPLTIGVRGYSWSPDGRWLFYITLDSAREERGILVDEEVSRQRGVRRPEGQATASLYLRGIDGSTTLIGRRPSSDLYSIGSKGDVVWTKNGFEYRIMEPVAGSDGRRVTMAWSFAEGRAREIASTRDYVYWQMKGPRGGQLGSEGLGDTREIVEVGEDGRRHSYGRFPFSIGHGATFGGLRSPDGRRTVVNIRSLDDPRFGIGVVDPRGVRPIWARGSLTKCDFTPKLARAACLAEGQAIPPSIVTVDISSGRVRHVASVSPEHEKIAPLQVQSRSWTNRYGHKVTGYIVWPRDYVQGTRYPAIVVTHGNDADQRFALQDNQWEYPVQTLAERGYVVLLINEASSRLNADLRAADQAWGLQGKPLAPDRMRELLWLTGVASFEDAVLELAKEGVVDPARVGIAGYSRGSQLVNVAMTQSRFFRAASSGDGGFLEPAMAADMPDHYVAIFGGLPYDPKALPNYLALSPSLRANEACGAILQQVAAPHVASIDFYRALRKSGVPTQISLFPGESSASDETHVFHIPSNRMAAMQENIAWFDYWLLDKRDPASPFADRYAKWDAMKAAQRDRCR
ncbi:prolyl oligopeptidase family serine peptidase [Sphingopyxis sp. JAI108]|uniref:prolyl oligopeptidase family serine peptidase n=1 Tax=Sphingopyxis sp. JAI108 TaxID=2723060 RepID=UPI0015CA47DC|nr:prolyl oligopeptidase family serine peptidase [Sphingopyxis sp. JAI108]NYF30643.1 dipeptidyl aminopeptidase/acylaminoacyl peptidase [Sphingopyxis sp. JAI108]